MLRPPAMVSRGGRGRRTSAAAALLGLVVAPLASGFSTPASAVSPNVVISEVYGAGGNSGALYNADFVELSNPTSSPVSLTGKYIHYRAAAGGSGGAPFALAGSIPANGKYLIQMSATGANGAALPTPDATATPAFSMAAAGGQVFLLSSSTAITTSGNMAGVAGIVDMVGASGSTSFETAAAGAGTASVSLNRTAADADNNSTEFGTAAPTPTNAGPVAPATLEATAPGNKTGQVGSPVAGFTLAATGGTAPYSWSATGLPAGVTVASNGAVSGTPTTAGTYDVTATVTDSAPTPATDTASFTYTINAAAALRPIAEIQGTGATTPFPGQDVLTQGVVTASYPTGGLNGFYIQTPGADTADASDAIFVYGGTSGFTTYPAVGDSVQVAGTATEFSGATQIVASSVSPVAALGTVTPKTVVPGTDCALPGDGCLTGAALDTAREVSEGELFQPTAPWTLTDVYDGGPYYNDGTNSTANRGEMGVAANSSVPLVSPTEVIDAQATASVTARKNYNDAHRIILDDASSLTFSTTQNSTQPLPWLTPTHTMRVGAGITFTKPVVFTFGFNAWRILPQAQVVGAPTGALEIEQTRPAAPQNVGGDLKLATFNVLNFFPTTGEEFVSSGLGTCTYFTDRAGNRITNNSCNPNGPRGAANEVNLARQRAKIVAAINTVGADIVSLEELENSVQFGKNRDFAIGELVTALNADAGAGTWAFVPSPAASALPPLSEQDVIRTGFIYKPANAAPVGESVVLADQSSGTEAFADAREPLAQAFKKVGTADANAFGVVVNHFKSKGSGTPDPNGQGNANDRRVLQANALVAFANDFQTTRGITRMFLAGDFNAYSEEDPIQVLKAAGYSNLESTSDPEEESYNFDGQIGSLDHVLANAPAKADVNAVDIWDINSYEPLWYEYSRYNTNVTDLYAANAFRSSDHNPEIIGINTAPATGPVDIQILGTNDFHGRLLNNTGSPFPNEAGAAVLAGAVKQMRSENANTVFAAAGDLIGASTFESFIQKDKPTIDALNAAGLEVSAVGNHEFDQGYDDLLKRVMAPYDASTNPYGGAEWKYIGANVTKANAPSSELLEPSWVKEMNGVQVGFIGAVTEHLDELVSPAGIEGVQISDVVAATNAEANALKAAGVDVIVLLVHEGAPSTTCATMDDDPTSDFGSVITGVNDNVDAIISGHTHLAYDCSFPVAGWAGRPVTERPVVSAGQYGVNLNKLVFTVDNGTGLVQAKTQSIVPLENSAGVAQFPVDPATKAVVDDAVAKAGPLGAVPLGKLGAPFNRGKLANGTSENRGQESTLGNLVAEVQRWATPATVGGAQIGFMNPGGLRADMAGTGTDYPRVLSYRQAADVQPFANTLVNLDLTGAQIKAALEQQWQPAGAARPFLKLGLSEGFTYTYDPDAAQGSRIKDMWLDGQAIGLGTTYAVTANSFLAAGGDNFNAFSQGTNKQDTGVTDLQAMVDYMAEFAGDDDPPLVPDYQQHSVGVDFPAAAPSTYVPGDHVRFTLSSLAFSTAPDTKDAQVAVSLGGQSLGTFPVDNTIGTAVFDEYGTATVDVVVPASTTPGTQRLDIVGVQTGTRTSVPFTVVKAGSSVSATAAQITYGAQGSVVATVTPSGATGTVTVSLGATTLGSAPVSGGTANVALAAKSLEPGTHVLTVDYSGDASHEGSSTTVSVTVVKATATVTATPSPARLQKGKDATTLTIDVTAANVTPTGTVTVVVEGVSRTATLSPSGRATVVLGPFASIGTKSIVVTYPGDARVTSGTTTTSVTVVNGKVK
ncbi:ExeM/NucH family extracellular endonuclease [Knoellia sp. CPCC 206450]|uniref:ExeM/NucH family extracellular endonuclease n=1 Tax=Knoellia tibetensis TaxID=3404798 RepID=UPI003B434987